MNSYIRQFYSNFSQCVINEQIFMLITFYRLKQKLKKKRKSNKYFIAEQKNILRKLVYRVK